jgi:hypothetical protein
MDAQKNFASTLHGDAFATHQVPSNAGQAAGHSTIADKFNPSLAAKSWQQFEHGMACRA